MRKLVYGINVSLDGCCDHAKGFKPDNEVHEYFARLMREAGTLLYGRITYQLMVPFWPEMAKKPSGDQAMDEFAQAFDSVPQVVVFSKSLDKAENGKTKIVRGHVKEEILKLKQEPGKDISAGGVEFPSQLFELGLVDEVHVVVHPVIVGKGRRLFDEMRLQENLNFKLVESKIFKSGCVALHYVKQSGA